MTIAKTLSLALVLIAGFPALAANQLTGVYHVHLFFGETTPFVDELTLTDAGEGKIAGTMHVP
ncbi:MAG: hypothetical protein HYZ71_14220, partial [Deltaproteobacteria bacterium]|nr:hypothetical protein [Deltaproteobacteria bacterium]